jgi:sugar lactone lactonase YvrE
MRLLAPLLLAGLLAPAPRAAADPARPVHAPFRADTTWREHDAAADVARRAGDWAAYRHHVGRMYDEVGNHPSLLLALARAETRLGRAPQALEWLGRYAAMGLLLDPADTAWAALRAHPGWPALARRAVVDNAAPVTAAATHFALPDSAFMPEGIARDPADGALYLSGLRDGSILRRGADGRFAVFVAPAGAGEGRWAMLALAVDPGRRLLWATTAAAPYFRGHQPADSGRTAVLAFELGSGRMVRRAELPRDGRRHTLGDMTVAADGTVYASDADSGEFYRLAPGADSLAVLVPRGALASPQGPAMASDGRRVLVADYLRGIAAVDAATGRVAWLAHADTVPVSGIDGLVRAGHALVAVQNGTRPKRLLRYELDPAETRITGWRVLESGTPLLTEPTHALLAAPDTLLFIADSGWDRLAPDGTVKPGMRLEPAHVLRRAPR